MRLALVAGLLCNDGEFRVGPDGTVEVLGDPTETALLQAAHHAGLDVEALRSSIPRIDEQPFDSTRKRMSTIHARARRFDPRAGRAPSGHLDLVREGGP